MRAPSFAGRSTTGAAPGSAQTPVLRACADALVAAGFCVEIPPQTLCCGRPLYDLGMLDLAERQLRQILDTLQPALTAGIPIVVAEPSCLSLFRSDLI